MSNSLDPHVLFCLIWVQTVCKVCNYQQVQRLPLVGNELTEVMS